MKILIIRFSSIGDIVLTTPVIRCLKKQVANAEIHYLTKKGYAPILSANPFVDKLHILDNDLDAVITELKRENFDLIVDLHHNLRSLKVKKSLKVPARSFNKLNIEKWLLTNLKLNVMPSEHIVDRYLKTVAALGVANDGAGLDYFLSEKDVVHQHDIPASHHLGYIGLAIGAAHATKRLPLEKLKQLVKMIDHPIIILGGPEDSPVGEVLSEIDPIKVYNACGKFNINESADLVRQAKLIISHDTGIMHIAAAFKKPLISVWGNTVPIFGMYPYYGETIIRNQPSIYEVVEVKNLSCRPCSKIGYEKCPKGHFNCMEKINLQDIKQFAQQMLKTR